MKDIELKDIELKAEEKIEKKKGEKHKHHHNHYTKEIKDIENYLSQRIVIFIGILIILGWE